MKQEVAPKFLHRISLLSEGTTVLHIVRGLWRYNSTLLYVDDESTTVSITSHCWQTHHCALLCTGHYSIAYSATPQRAEEKQNTKTKYRKLIHRRSIVLKRSGRRREYQDLHRKEKNIKFYETPSKGQLGKN